MKIRRFPRLRKVDPIDLEAVESVVAKINKKFKKNEEISVSVLGGSIFSKPRVYAPSGLLPVDCTISQGLGYPAGIVEIFGPEASGKSALLDHALSEAQKRGYLTGIFPMEYSLDWKRLTSVGVDEDRLLVFDAETVEDVYEIIRSTVREFRKEDSDTPILLGWDTIASTPTRAEMQAKKTLEDTAMGQSGKQMSALFRRLVRFLFKNNVCLICINQTREKIGRVWGSKETTYGGKALKFYSWLRIRIRREGNLKGDHGESVGIMCELEVVKNKTGWPPFKKCRLPLFWKKGFDKPKAVWEYLLDNELIRRNGTKHSFQGQRVSRRNWSKFYKGRKDEIENAIRRHLAVSK